MAPEVRLSGPENEPLGIVSLQEALRMAGELDVDLVEIAATEATTPVLSHFVGDVSGDLLGEVGQ
jgi:translation initiation factor IF-3